MFAFRAGCPLWSLSNSKKESADTRKRFRFVLVLFPGLLSSMTSTSPSSRIIEQQIENIGSQISGQNVPFGQTFSKPITGNYFCDAKKKILELYHYRALELYHKPGLD